eukprot:4390062-Prymnesium_polylepis.1
MEGRRNANHVFFTPCKRSDLHVPTAGPRHQKYKLPNTAHAHSADTVEVGLSPRRGVSCATTEAA